MRGSSPRMTNEWLFPKVGFVLRSRFFRIFEHSATPLIFINHIETIP